MIRQLATTATAIALAIATPAAGNTARAEAMLDGPMSPLIDPGPRDEHMIAGTYLIQILPAWKVRTLCPQKVDWLSVACTDPVRRIITMPDQQSSGLSTRKWLDLLRHELLHAMGLDFHGVTP